MEFTAYTAIEISTGERITVTGQSVDGTRVVFVRAGETEAITKDADQIRSTEQHALDLATEARVRTIRARGGAAWKAASKKALERLDEYAAIAGIDRDEATRRVIEASKTW